MPCLSGADLRTADLRDADLHSANLRDADLRGAGLHGAAADVGEQHDVVHAQQCDGHVRLVGEHVETGAGQPTGAEPFDQGLLVDDAAARDVDQVAVRSERVEHRRVDQLAGTAAAGRGDHEHVDATRQLHRSTPTS